MYLGIAEKIPYLKELGINAVMLLPCYEFDELCYDEYTPFEKEKDKEHETKHKLNYWGYGTKIHIIWLQNLLMHQRQNIQTESLRSLSKDASCWH